jgi:hypothetical protein
VAQPPRQGDRLLAACPLSIGLLASVFTPRPLTCSLQLGNGHRLIELGNRRKYLPHQFRLGTVVKERGRTVGGYRVIPKSLSIAKATFCTMIAGKAIGGFDDHSAQAIAGNPREQCAEARPRLDRKAHWTESRAKLYAGPKRPCSSAYAPRLHGQFCRSIAARPLGRQH